MKYEVGHLSQLLLLKKDVHFVLKCCPPISHTRKAAAMTVGKIVCSTSILQGMSKWEPKMIGRTTCLCMRTLLFLIYALDALEASKVQVHYLRQNKIAQVDSVSAELFHKPPLPKY